MAETRTERQPGGRVEAQARAGDAQGARGARDGQPGSRTPEEPAPDALAQELRTAWHRFVDQLIPHRPALYGYCRRLTGSVWDAEDLAQETLARAFAQWGTTYPPIRDARRYLLRTATHVWIDSLRRQDTAARAAARAPAPETAAGADGASHDVRAAASVLLDRLSPQESAALVLKEAFDMTLDEIAELLATTTGAVKAALHRGRERLRAPEPRTPRRGAPTPELLDCFIERWNARDVAGLVALVLEGGSAVNVGNSAHIGHGPEGVPKFIQAVVHGHPEWPAVFEPEAKRLVRAELEGEPIILVLATRKGREALEVVFRFDEEGGRIARIRAYGFCPDTVRAVGEARAFRW